MSYLRHYHHAKHKKANSQYSFHSSQNPDLSPSFKATSIKFHVPISITAAGNTMRYPQKQQNKANEVNHIPDSPTHEKKQEVLVIKQLQNLSENTINNSVEIATGRMDFKRNDSNKFFANTEYRTDEKQKTNWLLSTDKDYHTKKTSKFADSETQMNHVKKISPRIIPLDLKIETPSKIKLSKNAENSCKSMLKRLSYLRGYTNNRPKSSTKLKNSNPNKVEDEYMINSALHNGRKNKISSFIIYDQNYTVDNLTINVPVILMNPDKTLAKNNDKSECWNILETQKTFDENMKKINKKNWLMGTPMRFYKRPQSGEKYISKTRPNTGNKNNRLLKNMRKRAEDWENMRNNKSNSSLSGGMGSATKIMRKQLINEFAISNKIGANRHMSQTPVMEKSKKNFGEFDAVKAIKSKIKGDLDELFPKRNMHNFVNTLYGTNHKKIQYLLDDI